MNVNREDTGMKKLFSSVPTIVSERGPNPLAPSNTTRQNYGLEAWTESSRTTTSPNTPLHMSIMSDPSFDQKSTGMIKSDKTVTEGMRKEKRELIREVEQQRKQVKCCAVFSTILRYLSADQAKRPRPFYIGVTTVFILVCVMTMFKSVIDSSPILFVKIGQE